MNTKQVAQLSSDLYFIEYVTIQESPLEPGTWLYPPNAIDLLPNPEIDLTKNTAQYNPDTYTYIYTPIPEICDDDCGLTPAEKLQHLKIAKTREVIDLADMIISNYSYDYSEVEKLSWPKQEDEARALLEDPNAPADFIRQLADTHGKDLTELRDKIILNVENYTFLTALVIGTQQKYIDQIEAYTLDDIDELMALQFTFPV